MGVTELREHCRGQRGWWCEGLAGGGICRVEDKQRWTQVQAGPLPAQGVGGRGGTPRSSHAMLTYVGPFLTPRKPTGLRSCAWMLWGHEACSLGSGA